jgi:hypothetical protein
MKHVLAAALLVPMLGPVSAGAADLAGPAAATGTVQAARDASGCGGIGGKDEARLDRLREGVLAGVCSTSRWFDGLFGDPRDDAEFYQQTYGRLGVGLAWDELDGARVDGHFRANLFLPALGDRVNAVVGREAQETYLDDTFEDTRFLPGSFSDDQAAEWYAGLNYSAVDGTNSRFDLGAGLQVKSPLNPYVKARYRYYLRAAEHVLLTSRSTAFWENQDGFGVTLALDTDWFVHQGALLRWANTVTRSQATDGMGWRSRLAWYQAVSEKSAMRYEASMRGETGGIQPDLKELRITYRRAMWREWFFLETYGGAFWADDEDPARRCSACASVGVGFELMFGERYDTAAAGAAGDGG